MRMRRALTLVELLVSVAILILLAGVLAAVSSSSIEGARMADARVALRQLGVAALLYREERGGYPLYRLDPLVHAGYVTDTRMLRVSSDRYPQGYGRHVYDCNYQDANPHRTVFDSSFEDVFVWDDTNKKNYFMEDFIRPIDDDPALIVTRVFGQHEGTRTDECMGSTVAYMGRTMRFHEDGSVRTVDWWDGKRGDRRRFCWAALFSNFPGDVVCKKTREQFVQPDGP